MQHSTAVGLWPRFKARFIGDRAFYKMVLAITVPIIIQDTVTNLVNLLDNVMVGSLGTAELSGVAIANYLMFVFHLSVYGALGGAGIYGAQFAGAKQWGRFQETLRYKLYASLLITGLAVIVFTKWPVQLISLYLRGEGDAADSAAMLGYALQYLKIMLWGTLPFAVSQSYSSALRESGETVLPMRAAVSAVFTNLVLNYVLIFGKFGFPALGVRGAAIATVISRVTELLVVAVTAHRHRERFLFINGLYRSLRIGRDLVREITIKGMPLFVNEFFWSAGTITITQILSTRGLAVVGGLNIASTFTNLAGVVFFSCGFAVSIVSGQALGAGDEELAKSHVWKLMFLAVALAGTVGACLALSAGWITHIYNTDAEVRRLAATFMRVSAFYMPFAAISHCSYFAIRSGGRTFLTMLFDSVYACLFSVPYNYALVTLTSLPIETLYPLSQLTQPIKAIMGLAFVSTGTWARNLVGKHGEA